jgi:Fe-Mn family superoxide dismutase
MKVHHTGHHQAYTTNLNAVLRDIAAGPAAALADLPVVTILQRLAEVPEAQRGKVRNNGGGYVNHLHFFCDWMVSRLGWEEEGGMAR